MIDERHLSAQNIVNVISDYPLTLQTITINNQND